ncbi:MAG TPA: SDR family oxidoreductase [Solirubrobacteraceae bacterium]|nr:SDR family oxidoreductase [Solirubrobacteraceae bacterium]
MKGILAGRSALITGASQGLGLAIARTYIDAGANVFICARDAEALEQARTGLIARAGGDTRRVGARVADVSQPKEVDALVSAAVDHFPDLAILVNNAGIYGPKGPIEETDWDAWVRAININLMGSVLAARAVIPQMKRVGYGKIVQISGGGATSPMPGLSAYAASKAAVLRFAETLALELKDARVDVNSIAPGALNTRLLDEILESGPEQVGQSFYDRSLAQHRSGGTPPERGAELAAWLASAASDGITGKLISAIWDPWSELPNHREDLDSDVYTLRRIVPADRGLSWGDV